MHSFIRTFLFFLISLSFCFSQDIKKEIKWAETFGGAGDDAATHIVYDYVDGQETLLIGGNFTNQMTIGSETLTGNPAGIFLARFDMKGELIWAKDFSGNGELILTDLTVDNNNAIFLTGNFSSTIHIQGEPFTNDANSDRSYFITQLDSTGTKKWAWPYIAPGENATSTKMLAFQDGELLMAGSRIKRDGTNQFLFFGRISTGGQWIQLKTMWGSGIKEITDISYDHQDNAIVMCGNFESALEYDDDDGKFNLTGTNDFFVAVFNEQLQLQSIYQNGGAGTEVASAIVLADGALHVAGTYDSPFDFAGKTLPNDGNRDGFLLVYDPILFGKTYEEDFFDRFGGTGDISITSADVYKRGADIRSVTGNFSGALTLPTGESVTATGIQDIFSFRRDDRTNDEVLYHFGNSGKNSISDMIALRGVPLFVGSFANTIDFDGTPKVSQGASDGFLLSFNDIFSFPIASEVWVRQISPTANQIFWEDLLLNEDGISVFRMDDSLDFGEEIAFLDPNTTSYLDTNVEPGKTYYYFINVSNPYTASTSDPTGSLPPPEFESIAQENNTTIVITWQDLSTTEDGYIIERSESENGPFTLLDTLKTPATAANTAQELTYHDEAFNENITYFYQIYAYRGQTWSLPVTPLPSILVLPSAVTEKAYLLPEAFALSQNYPNPFNASTRISYAVPKAGRIKVHIVNATGQIVRHLYDTTVQAGYHSLDWHGRSDTGAILASGIYFIRMHYDNTMTNRKILFLR